MFTVCQCRFTILALRHCGFATSPVGHPAGVWDENFNLVPLIYFLKRNILVGPDPPPAAVPPAGAPAPPIVLPHTGFMGAVRSVVPPQNQILSQPTPLTQAQLAQARRQMGVAGGQWGLDGGSAESNEISLPDLRATLLSSGYSEADIAETIKGVAASRKRDREEVPPGFEKRAENPPPGNTSAGVTDPPAPLPDLPSMISDLHKARAALAVPHQSSTLTAEKRAACRKAIDITQYHVEHISGMPNMSAPRADMPAEYLPFLDAFVAAWKKDLATIVMPAVTPIDCLLTLAGMAPSDIKKFGALPKPRTGQPYTANRPHPGAGNAPATPRQYPSNANQYVGPGQKLSSAGSKIPADRVHGTCDTCRNAGRSSSWTPEAGCSLRSCVKFRG